MAITMYEILTRDFPWKELPTKKLLKRVIMGKRPEMDKDKLAGMYGSEILEVMETCWADAPEDRPTFAMLVDKVVQYQWDGMVQHKEISIGNRHGKETQGNGAKDERHGRTSA